MAEEKENEAASLQFISETLEKCDEVQNRVLEEILSRNADTEYLKRHGLNGCTNREMFKSKVPVVTYEDIKPDIQRIANGDFSPLLCAQPYSEFFASSGTSTGERKLIPTTLEERERALLWVVPLLDHINKCCMSGLDKGKELHFMFMKADYETPGGLVARTVISSIYKGNHFHNKPYDPNKGNTSPLEAILCLDLFQSMYIQLLCGLYDRQVVLRIGSLFPPGLLKAIRFLQLHYSDLCHDISTGTLNPKITQPSLRTCMTKILRPDPELAKFLLETCSDNWEGIIRKIWPNTKYLEVVVTGAMAQYIPTLDYYSGGLHKVCTAYAFSECFFGINLNPMCEPSEVTYTAVPTMGYFEFIPLEDSLSCSTTGTKPKLLDLVDLEVGSQYELIVTTYAGLYRYRVGDVLQVTGFHKSTPQFKFVRRKNVILSIDVDKTDESELQNAIESASVLLQPYNTNIVEFTSCTDIKNFPGHYVIFWELLIKDAKNGPTQDVLHQCCLAMEEALNSVYRQCRVEQQTIGPLEIRVVKNGTFEELMDQAISNGASINQYKVPRYVNLRAAVELLNSRVVSHHFSPCMPHWSPEGCYKNC